MEFTGKLKEELLKCESREEAKKKLEDAGFLLNDEELDAVVGGVSSLIPLPFYLVFKEECKAVSINFNIELKS